MITSQTGQGATGYSDFLFPTKSSSNTLFYNTFSFHPGTRNRGSSNYDPGVAMHLFIFKLQRYSRKKLWRSKLSTKSLIYSDF